MGPVLGFSILLNGRLLLVFLHSVQVSKFLSEKLRRQPLERKVDSLNLNLRFVIILGVKVEPAEISFTPTIQFLTIYCPGPAS